MLRPCREADELDGSPLSGNPFQPGAALGETRRL